MGDQLANAFVEALRRLEPQGDVQPLVDLYAEDSRCGNVASSEEHRGPEGAREFWTRYRANFDRVGSSFRSVIADDQRVAVEWVSEGAGRDGRPVRYEGVTVLETSGSAITRSHAYFNPNQLSP
jgi:ketosteroid isomerase-like protein